MGNNGDFILLINYYWHKTPGEHYTLPLKETEIKVKLAFRTWNEWNVWKLDRLTMATSMVQLI